MSTTAPGLLNRIPVGLFKWIFNLWPPFWGAGITVKNIAPDFRAVCVHMKLHWYNKNIMGVHFGGSLYSMTDPFPMMMTTKNLGPSYIIWDKAAHIDYIKPGRGTVVANFQLTEATLSQIRQEADTNEKCLFDFNIVITDLDGQIIAKVVKTIYVRRKSQTMLP